jgi:DNA polymerase (family 10)
LDGEHVRKAVAEGVLLAIGTDSHHVDGLDLMFLGVAMARRGWAEVKNIANTMSWEELRTRLEG